MAAIALVVAFIYIVLWVLRGGWYPVLIWVLRLFLLAVGLVWVLLGVSTLWLIGTGLAEGDPASVGTGIFTAAAYLLFPQLVRRFLVFLNRNITPPKGFDIDLWC